MYMSEQHNRTVGIPDWIDPKEYNMAINNILDNLETGSVSHGTMRPQDLIRAFLDEVRVRAPAEYEAFVMTPFTRPPAYAWEDDDSEWWHSEEANCLIDELIMTLEDHAPEGTFFGVNEGDGSDFGYWALDTLNEEEE